MKYINKKIKISLIIVIINANAYSQEDHKSDKKQINDDKWEEHKIESFLNDFIKVEGGTFTMGCTAEQGIDCNDNEKPSFSVTLTSFSISKYEVTQAQWISIMGNNPSYFKNCENCPVAFVSWDQIQFFLQKLNAKTGKNFRLPTEAEWEYAARGGNKSNGYKYAGSNDVNEVAWYGGNSENKTHSIGSKTPNELGIYDMSGNLWEWCGDWYGSYTSASKSNPKGESSGSAKVIRGGGWYHNNAVITRVSNRSKSKPSDKANNIGFRIVLP